METRILFADIVLSEIILVLLVILFFSIRHNLKQKKLLKRLHGKYNEAISEQNLASDKRPGFYGDKKAPSQNTIQEYFERSIADSLQRYEKNTGSKHPHLDPNHSFSGRTAALRCLYLTAEKEVFDERGITHAGWGLFERKLADIIRWQDKKNTRRQEVRDNRIRLMQDRLDALKGSNEQNKQLQDKIARLLTSEKQLKQYQLESQRTINHLQTMLEKLQQLSSAEKTASSETGVQGAGTQEFDLAEISTTNNTNVRDMIRELKSYKSSFSPEHKAKMDNYMNILEMELIKSGQYIGNLKKELKETKMQVTNYAIMLRDARQEGSHLTLPEALRLDPAELENTSSLPRPGELNPFIPEATAPTEQKNIISELIQLRKNNVMQRDLIHQMNEEIQLLKQSVNPTDTDDIRTEKEAEIVRLERLVKECQGCIDTLESEVDHLYAQLQERNETSNTTATENRDKYDGEELTLITSELEKTIAHYQQLHAINRLILELIKCDSISALAKLILHFIKDFKAPIGFAIHSISGKAEYFPAALFTESTIALVKAPAITETLIHVDEGTLFIQGKIHLMHLNTPMDNYPILETNLQGLVNTTAECIKSIELRKVNQKHNPDKNDWMDVTKNHLSNINIQYASQIEENRKTYNSFIAEIRRAYPLLELHGQGAIILDNAINEYEERMHLLLSSGDVIDREITKLTEQMAQIKTNNSFKK